MKKQEKNKDCWIAKFEEFLKENECYEEFEQNVINLNYGAWKTLKGFYSDFGLESVFLFVSSGFVFSDTSNRNFWSQLQSKWQERYEQLMAQ